MSPRLTLRARRGLFLFLLACVATMAGAQSPGNIQVNLTQPTAGALVGNSVQVVATVTGSFEITSAAASIGGVSAVLAFSSSAWRGTLDISSLSRGTHQLEVSATDGVGNTGSASVAVVHDRAPVLTLAAPTPLAVALPRLALSVTCADDDPAGCSSIVASIDGVTVLTAGSSFEGEVDLSAYDGQSKTLLITGRDSATQEHSIAVPIFVEGSSLLRAVAQVPGSVVDVDADRVLYFNNGLYIRDRVGQVDTVIPTGTVQAFLTPTGAAFMLPEGEMNSSPCRQHLTTDPWFKARAWSTGLLVELGCLGNFQVGLRGSGRYVLGGSIGFNPRRRWDAISNVFLDFPGSGRDVASNGAIVYVSSGGTWLYNADGTTTFITSAAAYGARTDGTGVLHQDEPWYTLKLTKSGTQVALATSETSPFSPDTAYQILNGWVAFLKPGPTGVAQVWRMDPAGAQAQLTFSSTASELERLGEDGSLLFKTGNRRFFAPVEGAPFEIGSALGGSFHKHGTPYVAIGDTVFTLQPAEFSVSTSLVDLGPVSMGSTSAPGAATFTNTTTGALSFDITVSDPQFAITHDCATVAAGASCTIDVRVTPTIQAGPAAMSVPLNAALTIRTATSAPAGVVDVTALVEKSPVAHYYGSILNRAPDPSGRAFWQQEATRLSALGADVNETWYVIAGYFFDSPEYAAANKTDAQYIADLYNTFFNRPPDPSGIAYWSGELAAGLSREVVRLSFMFSPEFRGYMQALFGNTAARPEVDMVMDLFRGLLNRLPDTPSFDYWLGRLRTAQCAGAGAVYTEVDSLSTSFMFSPEYANRGRNNAQFVSDMYNAFLRRGGDRAGVDHWINELASGRRGANTVRTDFINSPEFGARVQAVIAAGCVPP